MLRTHYSNEIKPEMDGKNVTVCGWVKNVRAAGSIGFLVLADRYGTLQLTVKKEIPEFANIEKITRESVICALGTVQKSTIAKAGLEIIPEKITVLSLAETPLPLDPNIDSELETRLDNRFIDLRNPKVRSIFRIKDVIQRSFVRYLEKNGFVLMNTPSIVAAATEGGTDLFPVQYFEEKAYLVQSPQLYKQMLMATGLDKVIIVTPVFRAEKHNTTRHLNEALQMDIELSFVEDENDALKYASGVFEFIAKAVRKECSEEIKNVQMPDFKKPKTITYDKALRLLKKDGINIEWGQDLTPEAEQALCKMFDPVIVTKWPTDIRAFYSMPEPASPKVCRAYDMLAGGIEVMSGAQRVHDHAQLVDIMKNRGMNPDSFEFYLRAFRYGMPPHAGWSFGLERLTLAFTGAKNIRECVLFPRDRKRLTP